MEDFRVDVINDQFQSVSYELPNAAVGSQPEYPSAWFAANAGKPKVKIPKAITSDEASWSKMLGYALRAAPSGNLVVRYLHDFIKTNISVSLIANWVSYERTIGLAGQVVSPLSLLDVVEDTTAWTGEEATEATADEEARLFYIILAGYRYGLASEIIQGSYKVTVLTKINQVLHEEPFFLDEDITAGELTSCKGWYLNLDFRMLIAALDMFWVKFLDSEYSKLRVCTLNSRYKDCSSLSEIRHLSDLTALTIKASFYFIFSTRVRDEVVGIGKSGEESGKADSYFPYMREMRLSKKSPYSSSVNVNLHNWISMFGALLGSERSYNARIVSESGLSQTMNLTLFAAFAFKRFVGARQVFGDTDAAESAKLIHEMEEEGDSTGRMKVDPSFPLGVLKHMKDCEGVVPDEIKLLFSSTLNKMPPPREGTIGSYLRTNLI